jgi:ABC-type branched-subunit amino acid transport system permease subunit
MENNNINEIGKKLDVKTSEIEKEQKKRNRSLRKSFWVLNALNLILSSVIGLIFGLFEHRYQSHYPFYTINAKVGLLGVSSVNFVNGKLTIPQRSFSILRKKQRIGIFCINLILSFIGYGILYSLVASSDKLTSAILYNVYDSSEKKQ